MSNGPFYQGGCECGVVTLMATGAPLGAARCDCADCRDADGQATALLLWPASAVQFADGLDETACERGGHGGEQHRCRRCDTWVLTAHETAGIMALPAAVLPEMTEPVSDGTALLTRLGHRHA